MLNENVKTLRKVKGISQEELASRLNVVRQTVSKWERGISVPDADTLTKMAEIFEVSVSELLGTRIEKDTDENKIAEYLSKINEQLANKNRRSRRIWRIVGGMILAVLIFNIILIVLSTVSFQSYQNEVETKIVIESERKLETENLTSDE